MDRRVPQVSGEARLYALTELCRRAGLREDDLLRRWRIEPDSDPRRLRLSAVPPASGNILFPAFDAGLSPDTTVRKKWPHQAPEYLRELTPDFVVPFARPGSDSTEPLFLQTAPGQFRCTEDLLASTALVLSRFEEMDADRKDPHGRFRAVDSMAFRDGYLDRPIVDEYGLALQQIVQILDPGFAPAEPALRVKVSHDIDNIGIPFSPREAAVQIVARRRFATGLRDLLSGVTGIVPGSLRQVIEICRLTADRGLRSTLYWKASPRTPFDSGYHIHDPRVARVMDWARAHDIEMGVHPGYYTFLSPGELCHEVARCRTATRTQRIGGRQHYLRWCPDTWAHWEACGLAYDSTVGYADRCGFRAGTCRPYFPWLWNENRPAGLLEIPLIVMDRTLVSKEYMGKSPEESLALFHQLKRRCAAVGGVMTLLWHNTCLGRPYSSYFPAILDALAGAEDYNWEADIESMQQSRCAVARGGR